MRVAVLGSGNGGCAAAFDWGVQGHRVALWDLPQFGKNVEAVAEAGGVTCSGDVEGFGPVAYAGFDLGAALSGAELVLLIGPAYSTEPLGRALKEHLQPDQAVVILPSSCMGSVVFKNALGIDLREQLPLIGETNTLPYGVRVSGPASIQMYNKLNAGLYVAALPGTGSGRLAELLAPVYPGIETARSVLQTTLQNGNPVIHPAVTLLNASRIESTGGNFSFYDDGVTEASARLMEAVDKERIALGSRLGVTVLPDPEIGVLQNYMAEASYHNGFIDAPGFRGIPAQASLDHRYLNEDVGFGMVFLATLGDQIGVDTPVMDSIIGIVSVIMGRDYKAERARTLESLGMGAWTLEELRAL